MSKHDGYTNADKAFSYTFNSKHVNDWLHRQQYSPKPGYAPKNQYSPRKRYSPKTQNSSKHFPKYQFSSKTHMNARKISTPVTYSTSPEDNYTTRKLNRTDKENLKRIVNFLESITIPTSWCTKKIGSPYHAEKTGARHQRDARQVIFGQLKNGKHTRFSNKYPIAMELFQEFVDAHAPGFVFNAVNVNRNVVCKPHLDSKNTAESLLVGCGTYTGGETVLHFTGNVQKRFSIQDKSIQFDGARIVHESKPFDGLRYSLVFFNTFS